MLRIIIESHRHDEPVINWIIDMLKFKQVRFKKKAVIVSRGGNKGEGWVSYTTEIEKIERYDPEQGSPEYY